MIKKIIKLLKEIPGFKEFVKFIVDQVNNLLQIKKFKILKKNKIIKLELGSSEKGKNGYTTIDYSGGDILHNLLNPLPLNSESVDEIYTSHTLEHFKFNDLIKILNECKRILKKGGKLKVCVPNARLYIEHYLNKKIFTKGRERWYEPGLIKTDSYIDQVNYIAYMNDHHHYLFDEENLINTLKKSGFENVKIRDFEDGLDLKNRDFESIYAVALK